MSINLDPRQITDNITNSTPLFVIEYITKMIKIPFHIEYYDEMINAINEHEYSFVDLDDDKDISKIIKFISPFNVCNEWKFENIINALDNLLSFSLEYELPKLTIRNIKFGDKTNELPLNLNQLIIYRISKFYGYSMDKNTSIDELKFYIEKIYENKIETIRNSLLHTVNSLNNNDLIKSCYLLSNYLVLTDESFFLPEIKHPLLTFDNNIFEITLNNFFDKREIISRIKPKTSYEAIIMAAIKYRINIIDSSSPLKEIENISKKAYIPVCQSFSMKYNVNRNFFNINKRWTEQLSNQDIYSLEQLKEFAINEGFERITTLSFNEINSYLKSTKNMFNFYFGKHPYCTETKTIMLTPLNEIKNDQLICFGIENTNELYYITVDELTEYFINTKMYIDPVTNKPIDKRAINKLKIWCKNYVGEFSYDISKLLSSIDNLDKVEKLLDMSCQRIKTMISNDDNITRNKVKNFLNNSMELGLYMRGWKVIENIDFPLESQNTVFNESELTNVDNMIDKSIYSEIGYTNRQKIIDNTQISYDKVFNSLMELPNQILCEIKKLHILKFSNKNKSYEILGYLFKGTHVYQDETLVECMKNIFKGIDNPESCMRTNSNWILYSSLWYLMIFGYEVPFRIDRIDDIM